MTCMQKRQQTGRALFLLTTRQQPYTDVNPVPEQEVVLKNDFKKDIAKNYGKLDAEISTTGAMQTSVKTNPGAIGYMSLGDLDEHQVNAVKFKGDYHYNRRG